ncbi:hypothetical protein [Empedobacter brevis]|uniref:hypothetical protein n=1 Tax=Empedobacter brevis TaxID=247 RepID=UPI0039AF6E55
MKITADNSVINQITEAIETSSIGIAIQEKYTIIYTSNSIEFSSKTDQEPNMLDFFWLGWFSNQYE